MAVPAGCWRIVYRGSLPNGERWQTGFWLQGNEPTSNLEAQNAAQIEFDSEGTTTGSSLWNVIKAFLNPAVTLDLVTVYSYPAGGTTAQYIGSSTGSPHVGAASGNIAPNQVCMVASLLTGQAGRSYRGRMYLPVGISTWSATTGFFTSSNMTNVATALATKFTDFNAASGEGKVVVVSQTRTVATQVLSVRVDSRPDIQRRRADRTTGITSVSETVTP